MIRTKIFLTALLAAALGSAGYAYETSDFVEMAWQNGAVSLLESQNGAELSAKEAELTSVQGPEAEFEYLWGRETHNKWTLGVTQSFEWPGVYSQRRSQLNQARQTAIYSVEALRADIKLRTLSLLTQIAYCQQRIVNIERQRDVFATIKNQLDKGLEEGLITILDQKKAALELAGIEIELRNQLARRDTLIGELEELTGRAWNEVDVDWLAFRPQMEVLSLDRYLADALSDPGLLELRSLQDEALMAKKESTLSSLPGFSVGYRHEREENINFNGFSVAVNLPSWNFAKKQRAAVAKIVQTENEYGLKLKQIQNRIKAEFTQTTSLRKSLSEIHASALDKDYPTLLKEALEAGEITLLDYLREQSFYLQTTTGITDMEEQYALLLLSLNRYHTIRQ